MSVVIETPNTPRTRKGANWEKYGWLFMRVSGPLLVVLIFTHLVVNLVVGDGIKPSTLHLLPVSGLTRSGRSGPSHALACNDPRHQRHAHHRE